MSSTLHLIPLVIEDERGGGERGNAWRTSHGRSFFVVPYVPYYSAVARVFVRSSPMLQPILSS